LIECAGVGRDRHLWIETGDDAALRGEGLPRQPEDVRGEGLRYVSWTVQRDGEVPAVNHEFEA